MHGFERCLAFWLETCSITCKTSFLVGHLSSALKDASPGELPKIFKTSLASYFSRNMDQEIPEGKAICLFPKSIDAMLRRRWIHRPRRKTRDLWNLLQSKSLAATVPKEMILKAYQDHGKLLSTVGVTPEPILANVRIAAREWAEEVVKNYEEIIPLAPSKAYFGIKRSEGGCFKALKPGTSFTPFSRVNEKLSRLYETRIDPPLIYLHGRPGIGKSFLTNRLTKSLSERFCEKNSVYFRNFEQEHWDGYHGQLITQFDDAFQARDTAGGPDEFIGQLVVLKSNCQYQPPMARLDEKGRKFTSEFIVLSGNFDPSVIDGFIQSVHHADAVLRRLELCVEILESRNGHVRARFVTITPNEQGLHSDPNKYGGSCYDRFFKKVFTFEGSTDRFVSVAIELLLTDYKSKLRSALLSKEIPEEDFLRWSDWTIPVMRPKVGQENMCYTFPSSLPENVVQAVAIPEPLKVRMITKSQPLAWALKPMQRAMWKALGKFDCFNLTQGKREEEEVPLMFGQQEGFLLSGDYSAATDRLNSDVMAACVNELTKVFASNPILCDYLRWESGQHRITYPKWTGIPDVIQTRGQLMGSLLSFPILCVANAATLMTLRKHESLGQVRALINGDDILFREKSLRKIHSWKRIASAMGLEPSVGKNYCSRHFGSINSQLILVSKNGKNLQVVKTGKFTVCGNPKSRSHVSMADALGFPKSLLVRYGRSILERTPESIDVPTMLGGLGVNTTPLEEKHDTRLAREIYSFKVFQNTQFKSIPLDSTQSLVRVPKYFQRKYKALFPMDNERINRARLFELAQQDSLVPDVSENIEFPWNEFKQHQSYLRSHKRWREFIREGKLSSSMPLPAMKPVWLIIEQKDEPSVKNLVGRLPWEIL